MSENRRPALPHVLVLAAERELRDYVSRSLVSLDIEMSIATSVDGARMLVERCGPIHPDLIIVDLDGLGCSSLGGWLHRLGPEAGDSVLWIAGSSRARMPFDAPVLVKPFNGRMLRYFVEELLAR